MAGKRGRAPAPLLVWIESPVLADRAQKLGRVARYETGLSPRLSELADIDRGAILELAIRVGGAQTRSDQGGMGRATLDDIANRRSRISRMPTSRSFTISAYAQPDARCAKELYQRAVDISGRRGVVELVGILGYYTLISMTLNTLEIEPPGGKPELR